MRFKLIVTFARPEITQDIVKTAKNAGATGDVIISGRGTGVSESSFFGITLEDRTDIILFIVEEHSVNKILDSLCIECKLTDPGRGVAIVLSIDKVTGLERQIEKIKDTLKEERLT